MNDAKRNITFVTGTRAEFGLMCTTLAAIKSHERLRLSIIATGMHLSETHGRSISHITQAGFSVDEVVPWDGSVFPPGRSSELAEDRHERFSDKAPASDPAVTNAIATGNALAHFAPAYARLKTDIVLVTGDRVEAFAAAAAGYLSGRVVAHVHGGDRAEGITDDSVRHAISKLAHVHFPATRQSAGRLIRMGEDESRVHLVGTPGLDDIASLAAPTATVTAELPKLQGVPSVLVLLHPTEHADTEELHAATLLRCLKKTTSAAIVAIYPNNDPGSAGIIRCWENRAGEFVYLLKNVSRPVFLGLLRDSLFLIGNSSSGIIEAASFGTPVINIGPRQNGRERSANVVDVVWNEDEIEFACRTAGSTPGRYSGPNVYGHGGAGQSIAQTLADVEINARLRRKLITY